MSLIESFIEKAVLLFGIQKKRPPTVQSGALLSKGSWFEKP
jgi:hypothetical protein